jgi:hypothetical protein
MTQQGRRELISRSTRTAFRETGANLILRVIDDLWQDQGFRPSNEIPPLEGERRTLYQRYLDSVDWADADQVARAIGAFERTAADTSRNLIARIQALRQIEREGYDVDDEGYEGVRITPRIVVLREGSLAGLTDPTAIRDGLDRITRAIEDGDPAQAIGSAKELIESTAKVVLREVGEPANDKDDLPQLVYQAQVALRVHPSTASPGPDGSEAVKKILGGAITITTGLAELRNRGYGTGHGVGGRRVALHARHAHLAVSGARLWCEFMLDTLSDPNAPWRRASAAPAPSDES